MLEYALILWINLRIRGEGGRGERMGIGATFTSVHFIRYNDQQNRNIDDSSRPYVLQFFLSTLNRDMM